MKLYLLRHGMADWPNWRKPDDERPLTKEGEAEVARMAKLLLQLGVELVDGEILTSPLPRARRTAEIAGDILGAKIKVVEELRPGFGKAEFAKLLKNHSSGSLMLVGHEPDFTRLIKHLTGGAAKMTKAGVALIDVKEGELRWLFPAKIVR